ncbi:arylesterase [Dechloromonas sp. A34]|uniref:arylesterase n=1 Tax=Dechloromonas sp. A34 TaxID=447588 RepID=UPI002249254D|nr:arylesterase [Dechloromonas sp. A34]
MKRRELIGVLVAAAVLGACGKKSKLPAIAPGKTVLAFGDSVTFGTGAASGEDWPTLLASRTGWQIVNAGIPGDTAEAGRGRLRGLLDEHQPALVIVEIGGNDFLRRRSAKAVKDDLRSIVQTVRQGGAQVVLVAVPELSLLGVVARRPADSPIYRELGEEEKVPVIEDVFAEILGRPELCADQIHPNAQGYREMATGIHAALKTMGLSLAP